jgi:asparagine synthase (glutamine-hydrolysing)
MCGIFGIVNTKEKIEEKKFLSVGDVLAHRGPDDSGFYFSRDQDNPPFVALAHRRLSIIDLTSAAHQPMTSPDGRYTIVFNGEIYNYKELSKQLTVMSNELSVISNHPSPITDHYSLRSNSDTEVLLDLYILYGKDCLNMLRGMFAFAIWDDEEKILFAARDRFGKKPFYYFSNNNEFIFSSELKAIKYYKDNLTPSMEGIDSFLRTGSIAAPLTIYKEVSSLLPGHYLTINNAQPCLPAGRCTINNYWNFNDLFCENNRIMSFPRKWESKLTESVDSLFHGNDRKNVISTAKGRRNLKYDNDAKKKIRTALLDSVRAHMVADVEVGAFLSGGIDSAAIVSLMRQVGQDKIKTINISFPGSKLDEAKYARKAADYYNTSNYEYNLTEREVIAELDNIFFTMEQPTIDGINTYFVSKAAKDLGLDVVLSGIGGDELFGGYSSFKSIPRYKSIKGLPLASFAMNASTHLLKNKLPAKAIEYFKNPNAQNSEYKMIRGLFSDAELKALGWNPTIENSKSKIQNSTPGSMPYALSDLQYVSMMETTHYMRNQLLRDSDIFSMAHSLELRVPFVDHLLYETVLPYLDSGFDKVHQKKMLVDAVGDLPSEIVHRSKMGFTFPFEEWVKKGFLKEVIIENLEDIKSVLGINYQDVNFESLHWSRLWALFVLSRFT